MSTNTPVTIFSSQKIEDLLLLSAPFIIALANSNIVQVVPNNLGFVLGVAVASIAKAVAGLQKSASSYEDLLAFVITATGVAGTLLTANADFIVFGTILGFIAKALPSMAGGLNPEDGLLTIGAVLAAIGAFYTIPALSDFGFLLGAWGKAIPSLAIPAPVPTPAPVAAVKTA